MKRKRQRLLGLLALAVAFTLVAASCGDDDDDEAGGDESLTFGVTDDAITVGEITDLSGPASSIGVPLTDGGHAFWEYANADLDGVDGRTVELKTEDSKYSPEEAAQKYDLIKDDIAMLGQLFGTPPTEELRPSLDKDLMIASPASLSSGLAADENLVLIGTPYAMSIANAVEWILEDQGNEGAKIALVFNDDDYGADALKGWEAAQEEYDFENAGEISVLATDTDFSSQVTQLQQADPDYVLMATLPTATATIIGTGAAQGLTPQYIGLGPSYNIAFLQSQAAPALEQLYKIVDSTAYWGEDVPGMQTMLDNLSAEYEDKPDSFYIFGWAQALVVQKILERAAEEGDLSREGILNALNGIGEIDMEGLLPNLTYGATPEERVPSRESRILQFVTGNPDFPGGVEPVTDFFTSEAAEQIEIG